MEKATLELNEAKSAYDFCMEMLCRNDGVPYYRYSVCVCGKGLIECVCAMNSIILPIFNGDPVWLKKLQNLH